VDAYARLALGIAIGAITFSGSVIAFLKLNGTMAADPFCCPPGTSAT